MRRARNHPLEPMAPKWIFPVQSSMYAWLLLCPELFSQIERRRCEVVAQVFECKSNAPKLRQCYAFNNYVQVAS